MTLLAALPARARALDVKLWPLFRYAHDPATDDTHWSALGPLVEFTRTRRFRDLKVRPLLWLHQRRDEHDDRTELLYPLAGTRWQASYQSLRFLLFTYRSAPAEETSDNAHWAQRFTLFPFLFYRHSPERGTSIGLLPFYLDLPDFLGYQRVQLVLFPVYLHLTEPGVERRYYLFPFVSTVGGAQGRGWRVWPFYGDTEIVGREHTRYVAWPFHIRSSRLVPGYGWEERRLDFPAYATLQGASRRSVSYGIGAYTHTIDERHGYEAIGSPWPLVFRERALGATHFRVWRFAPLYGRSERDGITSTFYAWPAWRTTVQDNEDFHFERRDALLLLWRSQEQQSAASGHRQRLLTLFPLLRSEEHDERAYGQVPALADSLLPHTRGVLAMWAPLYGVFRWDTAPDGSRDWNLLWGLLARERGHLLGPWHVGTAAPPVTEDAGDD